MPSPALHRLVTASRRGNITAARRATDWAPIIKTSLIEALRIKAFFIKT
jgi:hypothetical protein